MQGGFICILDGRSFDDGWKLCNVHIEEDGSKDAALGDAKVYVLDGGSFIIDLNKLFSV